VFAAKAALFRTLAHPMRVRALEILVNGETSVGDLAELLGADAAHVSQQLSVLRRADLVTTRRAGTTVFYGIKDPLLVAVLEVTRRFLVASSVESEPVLAGPRATAQ